MKYILFFILLFSSPLFGDESLIGKKIICAKQLGNTFIIYDGFEFISKNKYKNIGGTNSKNIIRESMGSYISGLNEITITSEFDLSPEDGTFIINRKNLEIRYPNVTKSTLSFYGVGDCFLDTSNSSLKSIVLKNFEEFKEDVTSDNLL